MLQDRFPYSEAIMRAHDGIDLKYNMNGVKLTFLITVTNEGIPIKRLYELGELHKLYFGKYPSTG